MTSVTIMHNKRSETFVLFVPEIHVSMSKETNSVRIA